LYEKVHRDMFLSILIIYVKNLYALVNVS